MTEQLTVDSLEKFAAGRSLRGAGLAARLALSAHALNNEGTRNNAMIERTVQVVTRGADGVERVDRVNAVSGDTVKHTFVDYLRATALDRGLELCAGCRKADPNRANVDPEFRERTKAIPKNDSAAVVSELVRRCAICDAAGLLVTEGRNAPRHSTIHFGWQIGIPDLVETGRYTHVKLVPGNQGGEGGREGSNVGQNIFTRPASSGYYALVCRLDLQMVGRNNVTLEEVLDGASAVARRQALFEALFHTMASPGGAQHNTQLPHLQEVSGALSLSFSRLPAPVYSPLSPDYVARMADIAGAFAATDQAVLPFSGVDGLAGVLAKAADLCRS